MRTLSKGTVTGLAAFPAAGGDCTDNGNEENQDEDAAANNCTDEAEVLKAGLLAVIE